MTTQAQIVAVTTDTIPGSSVRDVMGPVVGTAFISYSQQKKESFPFPFVFGFNKRPFNTRDTEDVHMQAIATMLERAADLGANAVIGVRFDSTPTVSSYEHGGPGSLQWPKHSWGIHDVEYTAYGTAVVLV